MIFTYNGKRYKRENSIWYAEIGADTCGYTFVNLHSEDQAYLNSIYRQYKLERILNK